MKRLMMFVVVLAFVVNSGPAWGAPQKAYVGLFADSDHGSFPLNVIRISTIWNPDVNVPVDCIG